MLSAMTNGAETPPHRLRTVTRTHAPALRNADIELDAEKSCSVSNEVGFDENDDEAIRSDRGTDWNW